jgi:hypothetical protein
LISKFYKNEGTKIRKECYVIHETYVILDVSTDLIGQVGWAHLQQPP